MGDFWGGVQNWWGDITGGTDKRAGRAQQDVAKGTMAQAAGTAGGIAGVSEADQMRNAQASASGLAEQQGQTAAKQGTRASLQAARTSGMNPGQAAMLSGQQAGDQYTNAYQGGLQSGIGNYQQATGQRMQAAGLQGQIGAQQGALGQGQQQAGAQQGQALWSGVKDVAGGIGGLISDVRLKESVKPAPDMLDAVLRKIKPIAFKYKEGIGEPGPQVGVAAQDLEKTPLASAVSEGPQGKEIDTRKLSTANLDLIIELAGRVRELEKK